MLYWLSNLDSFWSPFRLFDYVTFRAGGAAMTSFLLVLLLGKWTAGKLKALNAQAATRLQGLLPPEMIDREKDKTPCMGGVLIISAILAAALLWTEIVKPIPLILSAATLAFALIGFYDDFMKVVYKRRDGIPGKLKLLLQILVATGVVWGMTMTPALQEYMEYFMVPFVKTPVTWGGLSSYWFTLPLAVLTIVGASNAVNLTDGKDGLASGCTIFCTLAYAAFAYLMCHRVFAEYLNIPFIPGAEDAVVFAAAVCGASIGFLWHNCHPAAMFMGVLVRQEILLILVGGVFVMEALSVVLQVISFKLTKKRIFRCSPIHHHFEYLGWTETQIVVRFWILAGIFALLALATLKLR